jgi:hypothetical protein
MAVRGCNVTALFHIARMNFGFLTFLFLLLMMLLLAQVIVSNVRKYFKSFAIKYSKRILIRIQTYPGNVISLFMVSLTTL